MKDFLLIANVNAITYKEFFPLLKEGKVRGGYTFNKTMMFETPEGEKSGPNIAWFTTLPTPNKRKLILTKKYKHTEYPHFDNYRAIEVSRIKDIPYDYECLMAVPITIFGYDLDNVEVMKDQEPERPIRKQIEVRQLCASHGKTPRGIENESCYINGKWKYPRILIKKKIEIRGIWADHREEADFIIKGTPTYVDEKHKSSQGPVVNGKLKFARVVIRRKQK